MSPLKIVNAHMDSSKIKSDGSHVRCSDVRMRRVHVAMVVHTSFDGVLTLKNKITPYSLSGRMVWELWNTSSRANIIA